MPRVRHKHTVRNRPSTPAAEPEAVEESTPRWSADGKHRDCVRIHSGTAGLISAFLDRVFVTDYRMKPHRARILSESRHSRPVETE